VATLLDSSVEVVERVSGRKLGTIIGILVGLAAVLIPLGVLSQKPAKTHTAYKPPTTTIPGLPFTGPTSAPTTTIVTGTAQPTAPVTIIAWMSALGGMLSGVGAILAVVISIIALKRRRS